MDDIMWVTLEKSEATIINLKLEGIVSRTGELVLDRAQ